MAICLVFLIYVQQQTNLLLLDAIIFFTLAVQLLFLNFKLLKTMRKMFGQEYAENNFKHERRFLMLTMVSFSMSYLCISLKSAAGYILLNENKY